jgi:phosphate transport system protein
MMRKSFSQEMQDVKDEVLLLGSMVENAVMEAVRSLRDNDLNRSRRVLKNDQDINVRRYEIETSIMVLMATQQPIARDLRTLAASLDICTELERIGDYAKGIAAINLRAQGLSMPATLAEIYTMAIQCVEMLHRAMTAYADEDMARARLVIDSDDELDDLYQQLYTNAMEKVVRDPRSIERINYVIWIAHNLERLGDRATNICERVIFIVTGERYPDAALAHAVTVG